MRAASLALAIHAPDIVARLETIIKVKISPNNRGKVDLINGLSDFAKTKGKTGKIHGLIIVKTPPTYDNI